MIEEALKHLGLSEKETKAYLASLELGQVPAAEISRKAGLTRELTYVILRRLEKKGFISQSVKNNKKHFEAADPDSLVQFLDEKKFILQKAMPDLRSLKKKPAVLKPSSETFDGVEGIKTIFSRIFSFYEQYAGEKILMGYGSAGKFEEFLRWSLPHFIDKRAKAGIKFRGIYNLTRVSEEKKRLPLSEIRYLPKEFDSPSFHLIYPDHVAIIIFSEEPLGIIIRSKEINESYRSYFKVLWAAAKE
jgi:sugar-specific transcriptional regulator TrmB